MRRRGLIAAALVAILAIGAVPARAVAGPVPACLGPDVDPVPAYAAPGAPPNVGVWRDVSLDFGGSCPEALNGPADLVVALSGRFRHDGTIEDLAARVGAVSSLEGLPYWSVTDGEWRPLISLSHAIDTPASTGPRPDYTAAEVLSGRTLYMAQRDTRSHGLTVYALQATAPAEGQLVVTITNQGPIRFLLATLFEPQALTSTAVFTRLRGDEWGYYGLMMAAENSVSGREASFINRAAAFARHFTGQRPDAQPPLAP